MEALFYLYGFQTILFCLILLTLLLVVFVPRRYFKRTPIGWLIMLIEIVILMISFWLIMEPLDIDKTYLINSPSSDISLSDWHKREDFI
jgi:energy-coupling factor transporter transmembrane protein EcfT